jgi:hypothetical protein
MVIQAVSRRDRLDRIRLTPQNEAGWANVQPASTFLTPVRAPVAGEPLSPIVMSAHLFSYWVWKVSNGSSTGGSPERPQALFPGCAVAWKFRTDIHYG